MSASSSSNAPVPGRSSFCKISNVSYMEAVDGRYPGFNRHEDIQPNEGEYLLIRNALRITLHMLRQPRVREAFTQIYMKSSPLGSLAAGVRGMARKLDDFTRAVEANVLSFGIMDDLRERHMALKPHERPPAAVVTPYGEALEDRWILLEGTTLRAATHYDGHTTSIPTYTPPTLPKWGPDFPDPDVPGEAGHFMENFILDGTPQIIRPIDRPDDGPIKCMLASRRLNTNVIVSRTSVMRVLQEDWHSPYEYDGESLPHEHVLVMGPPRPKAAAESGEAAAPAGPAE